MKITTLGVRFFEKIQMRVSESKNGFTVFFGANPKTDHESIKTQGGLFGSNTYPDFWDSQSERFFGKGFEKSIFDKRFFKKKNCTHQKPYMYDILTKPMLVEPHYFWAISDISFHACLSSIQIIGKLFLNPYLSCFWYVCNVCLRRFIFQVIKKKTIHRLQFLILIILLS